MPNKRIQFDEEGNIDRKFQSDWFQSGLVNRDQIPALVTSVISSQKNQCEYIEELHDRIDLQNGLIEKIRFACDNDAPDSNKILGWITRFNLENSNTPTNE